MALAVGVDAGGSALKAWVAELGTGRLVAEHTEPVTTLRPRPDLAEFDPAVWWDAAQRAIRGAVGAAGRGDYAGITVSSLRQGFVLLGAGGPEGPSEIGNGVLNSDRRGAAFLGLLRERIGAERLYATTGHWPAPELTLPKLLAVAAGEPDRWAATRVVLFVHDWLAWQLSRALASEASYASAGQMADVARRGWATALLDEVGVGSDRLAPVVEAGTVIGGLAAGGLGLPIGLPVVAGCGDTQVAALGAGGLAEGVVTVVAGSSTPVQAAAAGPPDDPLRHPWVSTHARADLWAVETNAGYGGFALDWLAGVLGVPVAEAADLGLSGEPGARGVAAAVAAPEWSEAAWAASPPQALVGFTPAHGPQDLARAVVEAHAFAIAANVTDLERSLGASLRAVRLTGGAARDPRFAQLVADALDRPVEAVTAHPAATGGAALVDRALGGSGDVTVTACRRHDPQPDPRLAEAATRWHAAHAATRALAGMPP